MLTRRKELQTAEAGEDDGGDGAPADCHLLGGSGCELRDEEEATSEAWAAMARGRR
jgi:hypothetical protein